MNNSRTPRASAISQSHASQFHHLPRPTGYRLMLYLVGAALSLLTACASASAPPPPTPTPALAPEITFYDWEGDDVQAVRAAFEKEYGVKVKFIPFDSQEEAVANLRAGKMYDIIILEHDLLPKLLAQNQLAQIDYSRVPNFKNIWANFRDLNHDPGNLHSIPFTWGSTFIIYRPGLVSKPITRWADLWELGKDSKIAVRDEERGIIGMALKALGYSINTNDPAQLAEAKRKLAEINNNLILVDSSSAEAMSTLVSGQAVALVGWSGDMVFARANQPPVTYAFPQEGLMLWGDNFVIPANSPNKATAELYLNFLLRPEVNATIVNQTYYATANEAAREFIDPEIINNPTIFPSLSNLKNAEVFLPLDEETGQRYKQIWQELKASPR